MLITNASVCPLADNADFSRLMEEAESRAGQLTRSKSLLQSQVEELKKQLDEEVKVQFEHLNEQKIDLDKSLCLGSRSLMGFPCLTSVLLLPV